MRIRGRPSAHEAGLAVLFFLLLPVLLVSGEPGVPLERPKPYFATQPLPRLSPGLQDTGAGSPLPVYVHVTAAVGLGDFLHAGFLGPTPNPAHPEVSGPGACWLDHDRDGALDLYLVSGRYMTHPEKNERDPHSKLYRNNGDGTFTDVTTAANARAAGHLQGCAAADYTGNGYTDIFVAGWNGSVLLRNDGGVFTDVTATAGVRNADCGAFACFAVSPVWLDADLDGCLDLFVTHFTEWDENDPPPFNGPGPGQRNRFYQNNCDGTFTDRTAAVGLHAEKSDSWSAIAADLDNDGWPDLYVSNDGDENDVYLNNGDGTFRRKAPSAANDARSGMGTAVGDFDGDGRMDLVTTNYQGQTNGVFRTTGNEYVDIGADPPFDDSYTLVGWAAHFLDLDKDGHLDLMIVNGHTQDFGLFPSAQQILAYRGTDGAGAFAAVRDDLGADLQAAFIGRGGAWADYDNDGDVDFLLTEAGEAPTHLFRADGVGNRFLTIDLESHEPGVNRGAVGARVAVSVAGRGSQVQEKLAGSGFLSSSDPRLHFGLGDALSADVTIRWPDGSLETHADVRANSFVRVTQGGTLDTLRVLPLVDLEAPPSPVWRLEPVLLEASARTAPGREVTHYAWDFGDGVMLDGGPSETHAFIDVGTVTIRVTAHDSAGLAATAWRQLFVQDILAAQIEMTRALYLPTERPSGTVHVTFSDASPVRDAHVRLQITRTTGDDALDALLGQLPFFAREILGWLPMELEGQTGSDGTLHFTLAHNVIQPSPIVPAALTHPGRYLVSATGGARGSTFAEAEAHYHVAVPLP